MHRLLEFFLLYGHSCAQSEVYICADLFLGTDCAEFRFLSWHRISKSDRRTCADDFRSRHCASNSDVSFSAATSDLKRHRRSGIAFYAQTWMFFWGGAEMLSVHRFFCPFSLRRVSSRFLGVAPYLYRLHRPPVDLFFLKTRRLSGLFFFILRQLSRGAIVDRTICC